MDKHEYVTRLKKMLTYRKDVCDCCPVRLYYRNPRWYELTRETCKLCQTFNGLSFRYKADNMCPCTRPPRKGTAVERAWLKIQEYENKHGVIEI